MADESIVISVKDDVADTPADKFRKMAEEAIKAAEGIEQLQKAISSLPTTTVGKLSTALDKMAKATERASKAQAIIEKAVDSTALAQQRLATETAKTAEAEAKAALAKERLASAAAKSAKATGTESKSQLTSIERLREIAQKGIDAAQAQRDYANARREASSQAQQENAQATVKQKFTAEEIAYYQQATKAARDKLAANKQTAASEDQATAAINKMSVALDEQARKARLSRNQILTLQYTASDIVASLGSGISPLTIALQQGPQVAQSFTKELATLFRTAGAGIGVFAGLAAVAATLFAAYNSASNASDRFNNSIRLNSNSAGISEGSFNELNKKLAETRNVSISTAAEVTQALVSSGRFQRQELAQNADSVLIFAKYTGQSAADIVKSYEQMADAPTAFAESLNQQYHFIDAAQLTLIRSLEETGQKTAATALVSKSLNDYLASKGAADVNIFSKAWNGLGTSISNAFTELGQFLNASNSTGGQLARIQQQIAAVKGNSGDSALSDSSRQLLASLQEQEKVLLDKNAQEQKSADILAAQVKTQAELYDTGKRISDTWLGYANNVDKAKDKIAELRRDIATGLTAPKGSDTYKNAITLQKQQAEVERQINEQYTKQGTSRALAISKITSELDKQLNGLNVLKPAREIQQKLDQYEIDLAGQKIKLNQQEKQTILDKLKAIQDSAAAQSEYDRIYTETQAPLKNYNAAISASEQLLKQGAITQEQYAAEVYKATQAYNQGIDPAQELNKALADQLELISLGQPQREIAQQMQQAQNQLVGTTATLYDRETGALTTNGKFYQDRLVLLQKLTGVQQAYDSILAQTTTAQQNIRYQVEATNQAYQNGLISMDVYKTKMGALSVQAAQLRVDSGNVLPGDAALASFGKLLDGYKGLLSGLTDSFGSMFVSITDGFADAIGGAIAGTTSLHDALQSVAQNAVQQLISSLIKVGVQYALNAALGQSLGAAATATSVVQAGATATAWAPAAALASLATLGSNAVPASAGILSTAGVAETVALAGFQTGGYTGDVATNAVAGVVHGKEFVFDAAATSRIGVDQLEALRSGRTTEVSSGATASTTVGNTGSGGNVTVINNADNSKVSTSQEKNSQGQMDTIVTIDSIENSLASRVASGRGALNRAVGNAFGLKNSPSGG